MMRVSARDPDGPFPLTPKNADTWRVTRRRVAPVLVVLACLATACASSGFHYVKNSDDHTYFKVPDSWKLYPEDAVLAADSSLSSEERVALRDSGWQTAFDADPRPTVRHLRHAGNRFPAGEALVQHLSASLADTVSLEVLRNMFFDIDGKKSGTPATVLSYDPVSFDGGFHGTHLVARLTKGTKSITVDQVAVLDAETSKVYALVVACSTSCYHRQQSKIEKIVDSWTVTDG
jgi:hypothetical protein